jgi:CheY-like chemotaxis protein
MKAPAQQEATTALPASPGCGAEDASRRVLIADDNTDFRITLAELLARSGHEVMTAPDGRRALQLARELEPDAVLTDLSMRGMDGFELAAALRASPRHRHVLLVAVTGHGTPAARARTLASGFDVHLVKPVALDEVLAVLRSSRAGHTAGDSPARIERRRHTVVVADDTPAQRYAIARALSKAGYQVVEARNGAEALAVADRASAFVLDVCMPDLDGRDVARMLRAAAATAGKPIVHHSAMTLGEAGVRECHECGGDAFLVSPVPAGVLAQVIDSVIAQRLS